MLRLRLAVRRKKRFSYTNKLGQQSLSAFIGPYDMIWHKAWNTYDSKGVVCILISVQKAWQSLIVFRYS